MKLKSIFLLVLVSASILIVSCSKNEDPPPIKINTTDKDGDGVISLHLPDQPYSYQFDHRTTPGFVRGWQKVDITDAKATLGRVLFYDRNLSIDRSISCGSCHQQKSGFSDNERLSPGAGMRQAKRNSLALTNLLTKRSYFWDGRTDSLRQAVLMPIVNPDEMGMPSIQEVVNRLDTISYYKGLFYQAFKSNHITEARIAEALTCFVAAIPNMMSKKDKIYYGWVKPTEEENRGFRAFIRFRCSNCHYGYNVTGSGFNKANIGDFSNSGDMGSDGDFFVPSLRNVEITAPYMHDGSVKTLADVLDFYRSDDLHLSSSDKRMKSIIATIQWKDYKDMTDQEAEDIIAYLKTMTEERLLTDERFSDPFY